LTTDDPVELAAPPRPRPAPPGCRLDTGATDADDTTGVGDARVGCLEGSNAAGLGLTTGAAECARPAGFVVVVVVVWGLPSGLRPAAAAAAGGGPGGSGGTNGALATASAEASVAAFAAFGRCGGLPDPARSVDPG
jgi:hypothetical protein